MKQTLLAILTTILLNGCGYERTYFIDPDTPISSSYNTFVVHQIQQQHSTNATYSIYTANSFNLELYGLFSAKATFVAPSNMFGIGDTVWVSSFSYKEQKWMVERIKELESNLK